MRIEVNVSTGVTTTDDSFVPMSDLRPVSEVRSDLCSRVDSIAESVRARFATSQPGLTMTYQEKFAQANAIDALGQEQANGLTAVQAAGSFPIVAASVGIEATTLWDVAQLVIQKYHQWSQIAAQIERARLGGKKAINESASAEAAVAAYEAITWPT